ncbi:hypothetical protein J2X68_003198 [Streptomyces sp. 3330]|uniref:hypothetical protein n=1 Tax=Streptomyces sp. 3330 TaxID=2817755 RepID=UPI00285AAB34|nr:hypothetical protein [Streptomyces sp. 3330]MDR6976507.1 hypothetical protein [Streptomyces sp. 3330]
METFLTVVAILAMIAVGVLLIHRLNALHEDRAAAFHYARSGSPVAGPAPARVRSPATPRKTRGRPEPSVPDGRTRPTRRDTPDG